MDAGAYSAVPFGAPMFARMIRTMIPGPYRFRACEFNTRIVSPTRPPTSPTGDRGRSRRGSASGMLDVIARELGISRAEIRLRNIVDPAELPRPMVTGPTLDVRMSAARHARQGARARRLRTLGRSTKAAARSRGPPARNRHRHVHRGRSRPPGLHRSRSAGLPDASLRADPRRARRRRDRDVHIQQMPHGQSHETTFAQVAADELGVPARRVRVRYGDTRRRRRSGSSGPAGAGRRDGRRRRRSLAARRLRERILDVGRRPVGSHRRRLADRPTATCPRRRRPRVSLSFADVAADARRGLAERPARRVTGEAIRVTGDYDGGEGGWARRTHVCWVEVDLETGFVKIPRYVVVEDCGELINPAIVEGQIRGGVAQGIGAVLYEHSAYDDDGQLPGGDLHGLPDPDRDGDPRDRDPPRRDAVRRSPRTTAASARAA